MLCLLAGIEAFGLDPSRQLQRYQLDHWSVKHGLPHNSVSALLQSHEGFLWIGTLRGLTRFDGVRFRPIESFTTRVSHLRNVLALAESKDGSIWIATDGAGLIRYYKDSLQLFDRDHGFPSSTVMCLAADEAGRVYAGTPENGVVVISPPYTASAIEEISGAAGKKRYVRDIRIDRRGTIWAGMDHGGLSSIRVKQGIVSMQHEGLKGETVFGIVAGGGDTLILSTTKGIVAYADKKAGIVVPLPAAEEDFYTTVCLDVDGNIWAGSYLSGLVRRKCGDPSGSIARMNSQGGLAGNYIGCLLEDREGNLWIGTEDGLDRLSDAAVQTIGKGEGISDESAISLAEDRNGDIWVGTAGRGVFRIREGRVIQRLDSRQGLVGGSMRSLSLNPQGGLLIGAETRGIFMHKDGHVTVRYPIPPTLALSTVMQAKDGSVWLGTSDGVKHIIQHSAAAHDSSVDISSGHVRVMLEDQRRNVWVGTESGLLKITSGTVTRYSTTSGLPDDYITALHEDGAGCVWVGTSSGVARFKNEVIEVFDPAKGLIDGLITCILEDSLGFVWMGCPTGVMRIARADFDGVAAGTLTRLRVLVYGMSDGMRSSECSQEGFPSALRRRNGELWITTTRGIAVIDPMHLHREVSAYPVIIEDVITGQGRRYEKEQADLPAGDNNLTVNFSLPLFRSARRPEYRYRLEGFEQEWVGAGTRQSAFYTNLPPGSYIFQVVSVGSDSASTSLATLPITIAPRFYQRPEFVLALVCIALVGIVGSHVFRGRRAAAQRRRLETLVEERTASLRTEIVERTRLEDALRETERRQNAVIQLMPVVLYGADSTGSVDAVWMSDNSKRVTGFSADRFMQEKNFWSARIHPDDRAAVTAHLAVLQSGRCSEAEYRWKCADDTYHWFFDHVVSVQRRPDGGIEHFGILVDVTQRRNSEEEIRASLREKDALLREVHHRTKNNLAIITSLLSLQSANVADKGIREVLRDAENRVRSMAAIHELLYQSNSLAAIDFGTYIKDLVARLLRTYALPAVSFEVDIRGIFLDVGAAIPCALIVNELVTNACKYAFVGGRKGKIHISMVKGTDDEHLLTVVDDGVGLPRPVDPATTSTLGLKLVHILASQLGGTAVLSSANGVRCEVTFPDGVLK
jgi:two-component sensor histidine kinase/ligand-binding sensor domain-containing protein/PAS domain-containing protein